MNERALETFYRRLDRSAFVSAPHKYAATLDSPLPIGYGQTISQPSLVLEMTRQLDPRPDSKVLEIGTGSGYQTAFLAEFAQTVYTIEFIEALSLEAEARLDHLGYRNIHYRVADGSMGWVEEAPFDRIMVSAAAGSMPSELLDQLADGGRMLIPLGPPEYQELLLIKKDRRGRITQEKLLDVRFVEMRGDYGW